MTARCRLFIGLAIGVLVSLPGAPIAAGLVVHEWGTFTTKFGGDGVPVRWNPLATPSDLPKFVYGDPRSPKASIEGTVRMETPVLYFYSDVATRVSVGVHFPGGVITEWYPQGRRTRAAIRWPKVMVLPGASASLPREDGDSHYYPARETDAAIVRVRRARGPQHEKFLFYRGVGTFDLPLSVRPAGNGVAVTVTGPEPAGRVVVLERRADRAACRAVDVTGGETLIARPEASEGALQALETELMSLLVGAGLYEREARAMLETWRSTWAEDGLRVLYVVPRAVTDAVLPIRIEPAPASLVRVLVGRAELVAP
jgi:hypothetical protein